MPDQCRRSCQLLRHQALWTTGYAQAAQAFGSTRICIRVIECPLTTILIAKVLTHADTRVAALDRMQIVLGEMIVSGVKTNGPLHQDLCADPGFRDGGVSIHYLEKKLARMIGTPCGWPFRQPRLKLSSKSLKTVAR